MREVADQSGSARLARRIRRTKAVTSTASTDTSERGENGMRSGDGDPASTTMLVGVPAAIRMQMRLIVAASESPDEALAPTIEVLVGGSPQKRAAIETAIRMNDPLREQWERTWQVLRG